MKTYEIKFGPERHMTYTCKAPSEESAREKFYAMVDGLIDECEDGEEEYGWMTECLVTTRVK